LKKKANRCKAREVILSFCRDYAGNLLMEVKMDVIKTVYEDRTEYRNEHGELHREDGPAVEYAKGNKYYYINGELDREDGPAVENPDGHKEYYKNGKLHREDGPAVEYADGSKEYWIDGISQS
jgi:hypothetical protein